MRQSHQNSRWLLTNIMLTATEVRTDSEILLVTNVNGNDLDGRCLVPDCK